MENESTFGPGQSLRMSDLEEGSFRENLRSRDDLMDERRVLDSTLPSSQGLPWAKSDSFSIARGHQLAGSRVKK